MRVSNIEKLLKERRSIRLFDPKIPFDSSAVVRSIRKAILSPSSSNLQLWEFYHVKSKEKKEKLAEYCMGQLAAKTSSEMVVIVVRNDKVKDRITWNLKKVKENIGDKPKNEWNYRQKQAHNYYEKLLPILYLDFYGILGWIKYFYFSILGLFKVSYREVKSTDTKCMGQKSVGLAAQTFMLAMTEEGYNTCPMEGFDSVRIKKLLGLPASSAINMVIACGTVSDKAEIMPRWRLDFEEVYFEM